MANFRVTRLIPGNAREIVLGLKVLKSNVPQERPKRLNRVHFVALSTYESQTEILIRVGWEAGFAIRQIVVAGVFECVESRVPQRHGPTLERFLVRLEGLRTRTA